MPARLTRIFSDQPDMSSKNRTMLFILLDDKKMDDFLDSTYKEKVSNEIIQSIKEKMLRDQAL